MKLISLLNVIDNCERCVVWDDNATSIDVPPLFEGTVKDCRGQGHIRNGIVKIIIPEGDNLAIFVDIEYQKSKKERIRL